MNPNLAKHLQSFGINIAAQEKTVKSIAEIQLEQNLKFDFSMTTEDGKEMTPLSGPGFTGLINLGNSCYMASVLQTIFSFPSVQTRYFEQRNAHINTCRENPSECFHCQMSKIADGLLSGRYSVPGEGVSPSMLKSLIGKGHPEFSSMRQQDAPEYLAHVLDMMEQKERGSGSDPSKSVRFLTEHRLQCLECERVQYRLVDTSSLILRVPANRTDEVIDGKVKYQNANLGDCISNYFEADIREYDCPVDGEKTSATFSQRFHTYPEFLICVAGRFVLGQGWVMEKLSKSLFI